MTQSKFRSGELNRSNCLLRLAHTVAMHKKLIYQKRDARRFINVMNVNGQYPFLREAKTVV